MANKGSADNSNLANSTPTGEPVVSADSPPPSADSPTPSISPINPSEPVSPIPADPPPLPTSPLSPSSPIPVPESPAVPETTPEPSEATKPPEEKVDTNIQSPDNQAPQVQPEAPNDASKIDMEQTASQSAEIKPEPPEQPQEAPLANLPAEVSTKEGADSQNSSQKSFGDLLSSENQPQSSPSVPPIPSTASTPPISPAPSASSVSPPVSFGDLIKDIEITPPSIPEAERPVEQQQPTPLSQTSSVQPPPQSLQSPLSPSNPQEPQVVEKVIEKIVERPVEVVKEVIKEIPVVNQEEVDKQLKDKLKAEQSQRRILANLARSKKKQDHLNKIMELVTNTKTITNADIQRLLRVSQSTVTNYLSELSFRGMLKRQGVRGGAKYTL